MKRATSSKICHVKVNREFRDQNLGKLIFCLAALEFHSVASEVHFTLPESLWTEEANFFSTFGFERADMSRGQYRADNSELFCAASFQDFWQAALWHFPKIIETLGTQRGKAPKIVMSVRPQFVHAILRGQKVIEIRRTFSKRWVNERVSLYASRPDQSLLGEATICAVNAASPEKIWKIYGADTYCTKREFDSYSKGVHQLYAIRLTDIHPYHRPLPLSAIRALTGKEFSPPQSYRGITSQDPLSSAITLTQAVDGTFPAVMV
ncbi:MAG: hypothetical protein IT165_10125 [Bryobacterales bacterium]|nr:hypothetical protein [Bryobacterales bacterium]